VAVIDRMILGLHRETSRLRIEGGPLRHRPRQQHAVVLQTEVVMQVAREVLLDAEVAFAPLARHDRARWLGRLREIAFPFVFVERHGPEGRRYRYTCTCSTRRSTRLTRGRVTSSNMAAIASRPTTIKKNWLCGIWSQ